MTPPRLEQSNVHDAARRRSPPNPHATMHRPDGCRDEDEPDVSDDPALASLDRDVSAVLRSTDNRLLIFLALGLAAAYLPSYRPVPAWAERALDAVAVAAIVGGIVFTIVSAVRGQQKVAARYGLVCPNCGRRPRTPHIRSAAATAHCAACGTKLKVRAP